jgi:hypothetical protein
MSDCFEIISTRLFYTFVSSNGGIASRTGQVLAILVGNMFTLTILEALSETEINNIDCVFGVFSASNEEIVRLDTSMNYSFFMNLLNARD